MTAGRRRLDAELVRRKLVTSRTAAQRAIEEQRVVVEGVVSPKAATLVTGETSLTLTGEAAPFVGRGGIKLAGALDAFDVDVSGRTALDAGASTGGFTDCLLQRGVASVVALDVGYGQLDWSLRRDERVTVVERTNIRHVDIAELGGPFDVVVADLSFISLVTVAPALHAAGSSATDYVLLVKPQFEVGKDEVGRGGVVVDPKLHASALRRVAAGLVDHGLGATAAVPSPVTGAKGNREFFIRCRHGERTLSDEAIDTTVEQS